MHSCTTLLVSWLPLATNWVESIHRSAQSRQALTTDASCFVSCSGRSDIEIQALHAWMHPKSESFAFWTFSISREDEDCITDHYPRKSIAARFIEDRQIIST
jgi:hypothetical protein